MGAQEFLADNSYGPAGEGFHVFQKEHRNVQDLETTAARQQKQIEALTTAVQTVNTLFGIRRASRVIVPVQFHFAVALWEKKEAKSRADENDNSPINQFNDPLALPVAPTKWLLDRQSLEIRTGSKCG